MNLWREESASLDTAGRAVTVCLAGDVMSGRGIDQILAHPSSPELYEPYMRSAQGYVALAESANGAIPRAAGPDYIWGDGLEVLAAVAPDRKVINLETAVTAHDVPWPGKEIHYRMHPRNIGCITSAGIDCCVLANNHVMDWGREGLAETLRALEGEGMVHPGAGHDSRQACEPGIMELAGGGRLLVFALGSPTSGIPERWTATRERSGVCYLESLSRSCLDAVAERIREARSPGDRVIVSIHWGSNWGYGVPEKQRAFAHGLIDEAHVDCVHGHSSHHPRGIEIHRNRPILYGCGDLINDYEGIRGYERYRGDLSLLYFVTLDEETGRLLQLRMAPMQIRRFRLHHPSPQDRRWLCDTLEAAGEPYGTAVELEDNGMLRVGWGR